MTAHAAALREEIATEIQGLRTLRDAIARVTLLAAGFRVLFLEHGPQPETMTAVSLHVACGGATVAPVTTRATKLFGIVKLKNFSVRVTHERARQRVFISLRVRHA